MMTAGESGTRSFLYTRIYEELEAEIRSGKYRKGDRFPPERQLKQRFNTTHLTVRNALSRLVLEGYIERYSGKGTLVIYDPDRREAPRRTLSLRAVHFLVESPTCWTRDTPWWRTSPGGSPWLRRRCSRGTAGPWRPGT
jgi:DNA-binding FadR family transcriptional regulator